MAKTKSEIQQNKTFKVEKKENGVFAKLAQNRIAYGLLAFMTAMVIIALVLGGTFYFVIKNNINGMADKYRDNLKNIPLANLALPQAPDPEDPKYLSDRQLVDKYNELRKVNAELTEQINNMNIQYAEVLKYKTEYDEFKTNNENEKKNIDTQIAQLEEKMKVYAEDKAKLDDIIAKGDKSGFKEYFEKVNSENAQKIYADIIKEQKISEEEKKFTQLYESMDAKAAAKIFEQMGTSKIDLVVSILKNMKKESAAEILASMSPTFSSKITEKLSKIYMSTQE